jgi:hypothetical protein
VVEGNMRAKSLVLVVVAMLALAGCGSFLSSPPTQQSQQDVINGAVLVAVPSCKQLGQGLKPSEVERLRASLNLVLSAVEGAPTETQEALITLASSYKPSAPYAPMVAALIQLAINRVPEDARQSTAAGIARGIAAGCLSGLSAGV